MGAQPELSLLDWPDFAPMAEAMGGRGVTVRSLGDLDAVRDALDNRDRPVLVDVKVDPAARIGFLE
jgi:acetolactate synthase I/II/III large subunit